MPAWLLIYVCCGLIYAALCVPAITARGFPPIDPGWFAVTFLWVVAIPLAMIFDDRPFGKRFNKGAAIYCVAIAFIDAGTYVMVVPRFFTLSNVLFITIILYVPIHFIVGLFVAVLSQGIRDISQLIFVKLGWEHTRFVRWAVFGTLIIFACAFPFVFRAYYTGHLTW